MGLNNFNAITIEQMETSEIFLKIPKVLFEDEKYENLRLDAKVLYGLLKDRLYLSAKNKWIDDEGRVYLEYSNGELQNILKCSKPTIIKIKASLIEYGLMYEESQFTKLDGQVANRIYLGNVSSYDAKKYQEKRRERQEQAFQKRQQNKLNTPSKKFLPGGGSKIFTPPVKNIDTNNTNSNNTEFSKLNNSSRKPEKISDEISPSPKSDIKSIYQKSEKYIPPKYYSLLQVITDSYNGKFCQLDLFTGEFQNYHLTHKQKLMIGEYLSSGYITSHEILNMIDRMPLNCNSPLAYLLKMLENLKEERRLEAKAIAHQNAKRRFSFS